jgi:hypothetical protein
MKTGIVAIFLAAVLLAACSGNGEPEPEAGETQPPATPAAANPAWVDEMIAAFQAAPVANPPQSITRYEYKGQTVYYVPAQCCDIPSILYDAEGEEICLPSGGSTGRGDGRCPDFAGERSGETLIWRDSRTR